MTTIPTAVGNQPASNLLALLSRVDLGLARPDPEAVHRIRIAIKQSRAWLKLCRGLTGKSADYVQLVANLRTLSASLAGQRDQDVALQTLTKLLHKYPGKKARRLIDELCQAISARQLPPPPSSELIDTIQQALLQFTALDIPARTQAEVVAHSFTRMCKLGNTALTSVACDELHAWRKQVKTLGYQLAMVDIPDVKNKKLITRISKLGSKLGNVHDLCFLQSMIEGTDLALRKDLDMTPVLKRIARERSALIKVIHKHHDYVCPQPAH